MGAPIEYVLTLDCPEAPGIVHAVSRFLVEHGSDIIDNQQFGERRDGHFFKRVRFATTVPSTPSRPCAGTSPPWPRRSPCAGTSNRPVPGAGCWSWCPATATA